MTILRLKATVSTLGFIYGRLFVFSLIYPISLLISLSFSRTIWIHTMIDWLFDPFRPFKDKKIDSQISFKNRRESLQQKIWIKKTKLNKNLLKMQGLFSIFYRWVPFMIMFWKRIWNREMKKVTRWLYSAFYYLEIFVKLLLIYLYFCFCKVSIHTFMSSSSSLGLALRAVFDFILMMSGA